jgi:hypothetical protein
MESLIDDSYIGYFEKDEFCEFSSSLNLKMSLEVTENIRIQYEKDKNYLIYENKLANKACYLNKYRKFIGNTQNIYYGLFLKIIAIIILYLVFFYYLI